MPLARVLGSVMRALVARNRPGQRFGPAESSNSMRWDGKSPGHCFRSDGDRVFQSLTKPISCHEADLKSPEPKGSVRLTRSACQSTRPLTCPSPRPFGLCGAISCRYVAFGLGRGIMGKLRTSRGLPLTWFGASSSRWVREYRMAHCPCVSSPVACDGFFVGSASA